MVDTVLYFEGESDGRLRLLRAVKNRFGAVNELGVFAMTDRGLKEVSNPSAIFLTRAQEEVPGSVVMATWEGTRPMLVEVQALVDDSHLANPRRVTLGLDQNRLAMLLAVLHRHGGIPTHDQDVFLNVVGGVKVLETASDLALMAAVMSSLRNRPLPHDLLVFGEVGLSGEVRPVPSGQERLKEAAKHGFKRAIVPKGNAPKESPPGITIIGVDQFVGVHAIAVHFPVAGRGAGIGVQLGQRARGLGHVGEEVEATGIVIQVGARVWLEGVDHVRELDRIADEERREVVAHQVPVTVGGVELGGETTRVAQGFRGVVTVDNGGEANEHRRGFTGREHLGLGQVAEVVRDGEDAVGAGTAGVYHALGDALAIEALQFLDQLHVLQQHRTIGAGGLRVLVVANRSTVVTGQVGGVYGQGKQAGGRQYQRVSR
jgi:hypothetical protein